MGTVIRPEVSTKCEYYISKERYYELKHFCLQYKEWKKIYNELCYETGSGIILKDRGSYSPSEALYVRERYLDRINLVEETALQTDNVLGAYILKGVTEGLPYSYFKMNSIPCCKDTYYDLYRKFFYILSRKKDFV